MRLALFVLFGTLHLVGVGQTAPEFLQVPPDWKKGQRVSFDTHMSVGMTMNDSVPFRTESSARGILEVADLVSDGFVVTFQSVGDMPVDMTMDFGFTDEGARALLDSSMRMVMAPPHLAQWIKPVSMVGPLMTRAGMTFGLRALSSF